MSSEHVHFRDDRCQHGHGRYQVVPREWPNDAEDLARRIDEVRFALTKLRAEIEDIGRDSADHDTSRSMADARGSVQGAIVMLYADRERYRRLVGIRADLHARAQQSSEATS